MEAAVVEKYFVSIAIPAYNAEKTLGKCLDSILSQSYENIEIIVVNDGSKDGTGMVAEKYASRDERIKLMNQENRGPSCARNAGIIKATGKYILFIDSDDYIEPNMVEELVRAAIKTRSTLTICGMFVNDKKTMPIMANELNDEKSIKRYVAKMLLAKPGLTHAMYCKLFDLDIIKRFKIFSNEALEKSYGEDIDFVVRCLPYVEKLSIVNKPLYHYVLTSGGLAYSDVSANWKLRKALFTNVKKYFGRRQVIRIEILRARWFISTMRHKIRRLMND
jgi:glycosyltransferase involved in cell wall biosynthesis